MALLTRTFNGAQVFYVDPSIVDNKRTCDISSIDLYFKFKPDFLLNLTDQKNPGVSIFIAETMYSTPRITRDSGLFTGKTARLTINDINTSSDATVPTTFRFDQPISVETGKEYCFIIMFELLSQFVLWKSIQGEVLTGTTNISPGPSSQFIGQFFDFNNTFVAEDNTNLDEYLQNWRAIADTSLKFAINVARYSHGGVPLWSNGDIANDDIIRVNPETNVVANSSGIGFNVNFGSYEFVSFNENKSTKGAFVGGQMCFQNTVSWPGGTGAVTLNIETANNIITANTQLPNGDNFQWSIIFPAANPENRIVLTDGTNYNVRRILSTQSNTVATLDEPVTFTNTTATMLVTAIGRVSSFNKSSPFGIEDAFLMIGNSTANSTVRFVNNDIEAVSIVGGGADYTNGDVLYIIGFENVIDKVLGGYNAVANISTNTTGGITSLGFSNLGAGFTNSSDIVAVFANSTSANATENTSPGSGASLTYTVGATIQTEFGSNIFLECEIRNLDIGEFIPYSTVEVSPGVTYSLKLETNYIKEADSSTLSGEAYYANPNSANNQLVLVMYDINCTEHLSDTPLIPSRSNEFHLLYKDGSPNDKLASNNANRNSQSLRIITNVSSNSDFSTVRLTRPSIQFGKYIINNDATDEHTDSGNAYAKGLTNIIDFTRTAEDLRVYLTAYKPVGTDLLVYGRIYKNEDPEAFDDKNWSQLELKDGVNVQSSTTDPQDYIELTYGFPQVPPARTPLDGTITLTTGDATVTGANTDFVTDLALGDLVYMYQPLFVENHLVVSVDAITNTTSFEMDFTTANASILAEGMKIEKVTYPNQAFNNKQNDNLVRYYNGVTSKFDGYETVAIKVVFLSDSPHRIPRVDDLRGLGVSA